MTDAVVNSLALEALVIDAGTIRVSSLLQEILVADRLFVDAEIATTLDALTSGVTFTHTWPALSASVSTTLGDVISAFHGAGDLYATIDVTLGSITSDIEGWDSFVTGQIGTTLGSVISDVESHITLEGQMSVTLGDMTSTIVGFTRYIDTSISTTLQSLTGSIRANDVAGVSNQPFSLIIA